MNKLLQKCRLWHYLFSILSTKHMILLLITSLTAFQIQADTLKKAESISLSFQNTSIKEIFRQIEKKTSYRFFYSTKAIDESERVSLTLHNVPIETVVAELVRNFTDVSFKIRGDQIMLKREKKDAETSIPAVTRDVNPTPGVENEGNSPPSETSNASYVDYQFAVHGMVRSEAGDPIPGVNIIQKGTTNGTTSDSEGKYSLVVLEGDAVLVFSFIGFTTQEVAVNGRSSIDVSLVEDIQRLSEVVVVGYGEQKKENLTGSVATISNEDLAVVPVANTTTALAGRLPGLIAVQRSGEPGLDDADLSIRGFEDALVVVDGIVGRDFSRLDPNEIESITILKDAASAAVYGVSGGNGVILVTTKKGGTSKPQFGYTFNYGVQTVTRYPRLVNSAEFAELKNEASVNVGGDLIYTSEEIEKYRAGTDPDYPNFDYYDYFVRDYTPQRQQNITVKGGTESLKYFFLLGEMKQDAMWKVQTGNGQDYSRYNFRSNIDAKISDDLDISLIFGARTEIRNNLVQDSYLMGSWLQYQWPINPPKNPDGTISSATNGRFAYLDQEIAGYILDKRNIFQGNLSFNYKIPFVKGLSAKLTAAKDLYFRDEKQWRRAYGLYSWDETTQTSTEVQRKETDILRLSDWKESSTRIQASLNFTRTIFEKHNVNALVLYEENEDWGTNFWATREGYVVPIDQIFAGPDRNKNNNGSAFDNGRQSLVGRVNYDFLGKYLFEYSFRYDGSAKFPVDKRWGFFSGVSVGWRISDESFIRDNFTSIDNLKFRASWGNLGSDNTGNFQFLTGYTYPSRNYILGNDVVTNGMVDTGVPNPNITWEESEMFNVGFDLSLWKRLFEVEADVFYRKRHGLLSRRNLQLPTTFGASLPFENLNADDTRGFELVLTHNNRIGELKFSVSPNVSFTRSKWTHVEQRMFNSQFDNWRNNIDDRWKNIYWGLKAIGQFTSDEDIRTSPVQDRQANSTLRPGDIKYDDFNKDGVIDDNDRQVIGRGQTPEIMYGLAVDASWRKFRLNMLWQGAGNFNVEQQHFLIQPFANNMNAYAYFMDRWHRADMTDPNSPWIPGKYPSTINDGAPNNKMFSSFWLKNATYLRLKAVNISYSLDVLDKFGIEDLIISVSGQNLFTFTGLDYVDPEAPTGRLSYYPQQKTYNVGVNVVF